MKAIVSSMVTGGALAGWDASLNLPVNANSSGLPTLSAGNWHTIAQRVVGQSLISSGTNTAMYGGSFKDKFKDALVSNLSAQLHAEGANIIGDNGHKVGTIGKLLSHAALSSVVAEISGGNGKGAAAGVLASEIVASMMSNNFIGQRFDKEKQAQMAKVAGALLGGLITNSAGGVQSGASSADITYRFNKLLHEYTDILKKLSKDDTDKELKLSAAACALLKCSAGVPKGTEAYELASMLESMGNSADFAQERALLQKYGGGKEFTYGFLDHIADLNSRYSLSTRAWGALQMAGGAASVVSAGTMCTGIISCPLGAGFATIGADFLQAGANAVVTGNYVKTWGASVLENVGVSPEVSELFYGAAQLGLLGAVKSKVTLKYDKLFPTAGKGTVTVIYPNGMSFRIDQPKHLATVDGFSQKSGISGGHNADAFNTAVKQYNVKIVSQTPTSVKGISEVKYQIPAKHPQTGEITHFKGNGSEPFTKTIYDPKIFTDQKILELGQQASVSGYKAALASPNGVANATAGGVSFRIYVDKTTGMVRNFHPN